MSVPCLSGGEVRNFAAAGGVTYVLTGPDHQGIDHEDGRLSYSTVFQPDYRLTASSYDMRIR